MECGLLGRKLGHSYSPRIHKFLGEYTYSLFEKEPEEMEAFLKNGSFHGINVTIPYKKTVIPFLDELSPTARKMGAVNTIVRREDGTLIGHNTDYFGFCSMVEQSRLQVSGKKVLVLGSGGASNTAVAALKELGADVTVISRSGENNYTNLHLHKDTAVIVNTTPVGMYPNTEESPLSLDIFPELEGVLDVIYNPARTALLLQAEARGITAMNGLWMLVAQAKESAEWFLGEKIPDSVISRVHRSLKLQMENIMLIGMPGCGKSTVGRLLAEKMGKQFLDADDVLEQTYGRKITDILPNDGEEAFRDMETQVLAHLGKQSGLVVATGGGCVTRQRNYRYLHQNGTIVYLERALDALPTDGRPLSKAGNLSRMFALRAPLYNAFCDFRVDNNGETEETVRQILSALND